MGRIMIPFYLNTDNEKDYALLQWLNSNTNRSAFIRNKLYDIMINEGGEMKTYTKNNKEEDGIEISKGFLDSISSLGGVL